jgi:hypothetical protein
MQGLPSQQLQKSANVSAKGTAVDSTKAKASAEAKGTGEVESTGAEFASLFAGMTGKAEGKTSQVQSENGEILKKLLAEKNGEGKVDPKNAEAAEALLKNGKAENGKESKDAAKVLNVKGEAKLDQQVAKSNSNLDQLLNSLKGTSSSSEGENGEVEGKEKMPHMKNGQPVKNESKNESPLDFLMKGAKSKGVTETEGQTEKSVEGNQAQKKVMTGDDFIKNMQAAEKKPVLALIQGQKENANAKNYGQGMALLSDPLIKNTKDLADKDIKKGKQSLNGVDELRTKETKVGSELASLKQDVVPTLQQNNKESNGHQLQSNANQKVLDLSNVNTSNTSEIIKKISDYVEQSNVANKQSLDLTVKHESLGEFKIQVTKVPESMNRGLNQIDMQITTSSKEGHDFFVKNEVSLMKNLNSAGINLSDLRIVSGMSESGTLGQGDSKQSSSFSQNSDGSKQFGSFESKNFGSGEGAERRKELWEEYQQRYGA